MIYKVFDKRSFDGAIKNEKKSNKELVENDTNQLLENLIK